MQEPQDDPELLDPIALDDDWELRPSNRPTIPGMVDDIFERPTLPRLALTRALAATIGKRR